MPNKRIPKQLMCCELEGGRRSVDRQKKRCGSEMLQYRPHVPGIPGSRLPNVKL
uniref:Uncharacterized protein n=1 Tax=Arion vulgaris TaxID=1028688 RepID=A0A0B7AA69_9EUPU